MSISNLEKFFDEKDYDNVCAELEIFRSIFIDNRYPDVSHLIVHEIDDAKKCLEYDYMKSFDFTLNYLLGRGKEGSYRIGKQNALTLHDALFDLNQNMDFDKLSKRRQDSLDDERDTKKFKSDD